MRIANCVIPCIAATFATVALFGCSQESGREFDIPNSLCSVKTPKDSISNLLPDSGGDFSVEFIEGKRTNCEVYIDGAFAVEFAYTRSERSYDPYSEVERDALDRPRKMRGLSSGSKGIAGESGSMLITKCDGPKSDYLVIDLSVNPELNEDEKQRRADMQEFSVAYLKNAKKKESCTA